jgi:predicted O-methyltransferase YrrM
MEPIHDGGSGSMNEVELAHLAWSIVDRQATAVLEVGTGRGASTTVLNEAVSGRVVTLDVNHATVQHYIGDDFRDKLGKTTFIQADSHSFAAIELVARYGPYDTLLIDGDHYYPGVNQDYLNFAPLLAPGGVCFIHDIEWGDVRVFWERGLPLRRPLPGHLHPPVLHKLGPNLGVVLFPTPPNGRLDVS